MNTKRDHRGLPDYSRVADGDNGQEATGCGGSYQCPTDPQSGGPETATSVSCAAVGENIGESSPVADSPAAITQVALALTENMLSEQEPDDICRENILSSVFHHVTIAIFRNNFGTVWIILDFST
jgi:hypothetical protein